MQFRLKAELTVLLQGVISIVEAHQKTGRGKISLQIC